LFEIRTKIFLSEYAIVLATFLAIQVVGMDAGIVIGVLVSIVDHVVHSAKTTGVYRVKKRSRAVWTPEQHKLLQDQGYQLQSPKIVTLGKLWSMFVFAGSCCWCFDLSDKNDFFAEIAGNIFFGSSLGLLQRIVDELGINMQDDYVREKPAFCSPHASPFQALKDRRPSVLNATKRNAVYPRSPPQYLAIDLSKLHNLDGKFNDSNRNHVFV
jgi:hypothetical protein